MRLLEELQWERKKTGVNIFAEIAIESARKLKTQKAEEENGGAAT